MGWKSKKDGTHYNTDKTVRSSEPGTEVNIEIDNNSDDFAEDVKNSFSESEKHTFGEWQEIGLGIRKRDKTKDNPNSYIVNGTEEENIKLLKEYGGFENITPDGYFTGYFYLDDGEGDSGHAVYHGKVSDHKFTVKMNKNDIPRKWRDQRDDLLDDAIAKINDALD